MTALFVPYRVSDLAADQAGATIAVGAGGSGDFVVTAGGVDRFRVGYGGLVTIGAGDNQNINGGVPVTGALGQITLGSAASPDTGLHSALKVSRIFSIANTAPAGDGEEQLAAITAVSTGDANNQCQPVGLYGGANNYGTTDPGGTACHPDAVGVYGVGHIKGASGIGTAGGIGSGFGGVFAGRTESTASTSRARGVEISAQNYTAGSGSVNHAFDFTYDPTATVNNRAIGVYIESQGTANSAAAILVGNTNGVGVQYDVGLAFTGELSGGVNGPVKTTTISDDSHSVTSFKVNGSHTIGIDLSGGTFSGAPILLGNASPIQAVNGAGNANYNLIRLLAGNNLALGDSNVGAVVIPNNVPLRGYSADGSTTYVIGLINGSNQVTVGASGVQTNLSGSSVVVTTTLSLGAQNIVTDTATGTKIGTATNQKWSIWNATPIAQPTTSIASATFVANSGTAVNTASTFDGYTIPQAFKALRNFGLLA